MECCVDKYSDLSEYVRNTFSIGLLFLEEKFDGFDLVYNRTEILIWVL
jgi:hypothetical protein